MKGLILPDHIPLNRYQLLVVGGPPLIFTSIDGLEEELETVDLPDRTVASGGNTKSFEFVAMHPKHHTGEDDYLEEWFEQSQIVLPTYKRAATLLVETISGIQVRSYNLIGLFPSKRKTPDLEMNNEGELFETEWTFKGDRIIPI